MVKNLDIPFKLMISRIVILWVFWRLKNQERGTQNNKRGGLIQGSVKGRGRGSDGGGRIPEEWRNGREGVEGKTQVDRNVVEEERLCCTGGKFIVDPFVGSRQPR
jgi:hypothetical protein